MGSQNQPSRKPSPTDRGERADVFLVTHGYSASRSEAQAAIRAGAVEADGQIVAKPAQSLRPDMVIRYAPAHPFVSRGGVKLAAALEHFGLSPANRVCLDIGASTGGFTQILLNANAARVYALDVGHGQFSPKLISDPRIVLIEKTNARDLTELHVPEPIAAIVADVSFISLKLATPAALALAAPGAWALLLVKPQFELGRRDVGKGGVVRRDAARARAVNAIVDWLTGQQWQVLGTMESPIAGGSGNRETFVAATRL